MVDLTDFDNKPRFSKFKNLPECPHNCANQGDDCIDCFKFSNFVRKKLIYKEETK
jgi:hypothetical protein